MLSHDANRADMHATKTQNFDTSVVISNAHFQHETIELEQFRADLSRLEEVLAMSQRIGAIDIADAIENIASRLADLHRLELERLAMLAL